MFNEGDVIDEKYYVTKNHEIGSGGYGTVIEVKELSNNQIYALKYCTSKDDEDLRRFKREITTMKRIKHKNVIEIVDSNANYDLPYFVMPLATISGNEFMDKTKNDLEATYQVFSSMCEGLMAIHNEGVTHRDIKPANILIFQNSETPLRIVVSDLGLSKCNDSESTVITQSGVGMGTYDYSPPENYGLRNVKNATNLGDVYMAALTLYAFYTGEPPKRGGIKKEKLPTRLYSIIKKATEFDPKNRYKSIAALKDAVADFINISQKLKNEEETKELINIITSKDELETLTKNDADVKKLASYLAILTESENFINLINNIPENILKYISQLDNDDTHSLIKLYCEKNNKIIHMKKYQYADILGARLEIFYNNTTSNTIKVSILESLLLTAQKLNRYYVMNIFDNLLSHITDRDLGFMVADMLKEESVYVDAYSRLQKEKLISSLHSAWENAECKSKIQFDNSASENSPVEHLLNLDD